MFQFVFIVELVIATDANVELWTMTLFVTNQIFPVEKQRKSLDDSKFSD